MESMKDLGERIKTERIAQGYSVKSAAEKSGIARDTWRKIEAGDSVQDTKRHVAMEFLGISDANFEWGTVGRLEDHAADFTGSVDLNLMFSQAVRFTSTLGLLVPEVREDAERVQLELSDLFSKGFRLWDRKLPDDRDEGGDEDVAFRITGDAHGSTPEPSSSAHASTERPRLRSGRTSRRWPSSWRSPSR